jgi:hypothetical protein
MTTGSIDQQVGQRMDTFRGNPEKLQQRSKVSGSLLDLLALQKLTSEKKAAAADLQLKMQQDPSTVKQKLEQEALSLVKQGMGNKIKNVAGALNQKQAMQQKNLQRIAKGNKPPAGISGLPGLGGKPLNINPQAAGLANARMAQVAGQGGPRRMAQGGVVGFQSGEDVNLGTTPFGRLAQSMGRGIQNQYDWAKNQGWPNVRDFLTPYGASPESTLRNSVLQKFRKFSDPFKESTKAQYNFARDVIKNIHSYTPAQLEELNRINPSELPPHTALAFEQVDDKVGIRDSISKVDALKRGSDVLPVAGTRRIGQMVSPPKLSTNFGPDYNLTQPPLWAEPEILDSNASTLLYDDLAHKNRTNLGTSLETPEKPVSGVPDKITDAVDVYQGRGRGRGAGGGTGGGLESIMMGSAAVADKITGRKDKAARFDEMIAEFKAKEAELFDPAMERSQRVTDFLVAGGDTTTLGSFAKEAVGASRATQTRQNAATMKRMSDMFSLETAGMGIDAELGAKAISLGTAVFNQAEQSKRSAQQIASQRSTAALNALVDSAKLEYQKSSDADKLVINSILAEVAVKNAETQEKRVEFDAARETRISEQAIKAAEVALQNSQLAEWQGYNKLIVDLASGYVTEAEKKITDKITGLLETTPIGDKDAKEKINAQIAKLNKQLNDSTYIIGLATEKANVFLLGLPNDIGKIILDRYDYLTPLVKGQLGRAGDPLGGVTTRTVRE